jgi:hypothetical protein
MAQSLKVTVFREGDGGAWLDDQPPADEFTVPFEVVELQTGTAGDEMVFIGANGERVNAIDLDDYKLERSAT